MVIGKKKFKRYDWNRNYLKKLDPILEEYGFDIKTREIPEEKFSFL